MKKHPGDLNANHFKPHTDSKKVILCFIVFAEKPSSVEIVDKADALQKDKLVTVRRQTHSTFWC